MDMCIFGQNRTIQLIHTYWTPEFLKKYGTWHECFPACGRMSIFLWGQRPILFLLTLPVTLVTLGLFLFVLNGLLFWAVGSFLDGFRVAGFWPGVFGAIVYTLISWALSALVQPQRRA